MEHKNTKKQTYSGSKKAGTAIVAVLTSVALMATGWVSSLLFKNHKTKDKEDTKIVQEENELKISEDFDINDDKAVEARAKAIYELTDKEFDELTIKNVLYIMNGRADKLVYPENIKTDEEKFRYLQSLALVLGGVYDDFITDNTKMGARAYMFMPVSNDAKEMAKKVAEVIAKQKKALYKNTIDGAAVDTTELEINAKEFYGLYNETLQMVKDGKLTDGEVVMLVKEFDANNALFTMYLTKEEAEDLNKAQGITNPYQDQLFQNTAKGLNIYDIMEEAMEKDDKCGRKLGEEYKAEDKKDAEKIINEVVPGNNEKKVETTEIVDQGGKHVGTESKPISGDNGSKGGTSTSEEPTTVVETNEFVVELPDAGTSTSTDKGGEVVNEETYTYKQEESTTTYSDADEEIEVIGGYHIG